MTAEPTPSDVEIPEDATPCSAARVLQTGVAAAVIAWCTLAVALVAPTDVAVPEPPPVETPSATRVVAGLRIRAEGVSADALVDEIRLRLPDVEIVSWRAAPRDAGPDALVVFVDVRPASERTNALVLTLVASDGRAYDRVVEIEADAPAGSTEELVARNVVNLVFGIESGTVAPDRNEVPMPAATASPPCPACPPVAPPREPEPVAPPPREPRVELGPGLTFGAITGLGPPSTVDRFAAWGGELSFAARWRSGGALFVGVRSTGRSHPLGAGIVRIRAAVGGGWIWRPQAGGFELAALLGGSVEPWFVLDDDTEVVSSVGALPTIGAWGRVAPGYLLRVDGRGVAARIGAFAELDVAYAPRGGGVGIVRGREGDREVSMFRIGGAEVVLGLDVRVWVSR